MEREKGKIEKKKCRGSAVLAGMRTCVLEKEWKRPTVNVAIWKEGERRRKKGDDGGGKEQGAWRAGRVRGEEEDDDNVIAALWRVGSHSESKLVWCPSLNTQLSELQHCAPNLCVASLSCFLFLLFFPPLLHMLHTAPYVLKH